MLDQYTPFGTQRRLPPPTDSDDVRARWIRRVFCALLVAVGFAASLALPTHADEERFEPSTRGGRDAVEELAYRYFPAPLVPWVMRTARCESGFDLYAENPKGYVGFDRRLGVRYHFRGPLQVDEVTWGDEARERFGGELSDPNVSMAMAASIVDRYGTGHWPVCGRGGW